MRERIVSRAQEQLEVGHAHEGELDGVDAQLKQVGAHLLELLACDGDIQRSSCTEWHGSVWHGCDFVPDGDIE